MAEFRSNKERATWVKLIQELEAIPIEAGGAENLRQKMALLSAAVGMLPYEPELTTALKSAVSRLASEIQSAKTYTNTKLSRDIKDLERQIIKAGERARQQNDEKKTSRGRLVAKHKGRDYERFDFATYKKVAREQLLELLDQNKLGNPVGELKKLVVESLKALEAKDLIRYNKLQSEIQKFQEDDQIGTIAERLVDLQEVIIKKTDEERSKRREFIRNVSDSVMDKLSKLGVGPVNAANALRAGTALSRITGRALLGGFNLAASGVTAVNNRRRVNAAVAQVQGMQAAEEESGYKNELDRINEEKKDDQRKRFLNLFARQVEAIKDLTKSNEEREGSSFLGRFGAMLGAMLSALGIKGLLRTGGKVSWEILKKALLGMGVAASGLVGKIGGSLMSMFKVAAKAGGGVLTRLGTMAARFLPFFLKRAVVFIPVVGTLLAGILWGKDIYDAVQKFVMPYIQPMVDRMGEWLVETWTWTKNKFTETVDKVKKFVEPVQTAIKGIVETIGNFLSKPIEAIKGMMNWLIEKAGDNPIFKKAFQAIQSGLNLANKINPLSSAADAAMSLPGAISGTVSTIQNNASNWAEKGMELGKSAAASVGNAASNAMSYASNAVSEGYSAMKSSLGRLFTKKSDVHLDGVHPALQNNFMGMVEEYRARGGTKPVVITSAYRSFKEQADLYKKYGPGRAAPPGRSLHEYGLAIDADRGALNEMDKMGLIQKYGLSRPIRGEPWHVQPQGVSLAAAKEGVYSADAAAHQGGVGLPKAASIEPIKEPVPNVVSPASPTNAQPRSVVMKPATGSPQQPSPINLDSIPQYSYNDGAFFATNLGMFAR